MCSGDASARCGAPLGTSGGLSVSCRLAKGHDGEHEFMASSGADTQALTAEMRRSLVALRLEVPAEVAVSVEEHVRVVVDALAARVRELEAERDLAFRQRDNLSRIARRWSENHRRSVARAETLALAERQAFADCEKAAARAETAENALTKIEANALALTGVPDRDKLVGIWQECRRVLGDPEARAVLAGSRPEAPKEAPRSGAEEEQT